MICCAFVTPGLFPVTVAFRLASLLIKVDLPTLGIPNTIALIARGFKPLAFSFSILSFNT